MPMSDTCSSRKAVKRYMLIFFSEWPYFIPFVSVGPAGYSDKSLYDPQGLVSSFGLVG
jgi:hypothetical protein